MPLNDDCVRDTSEKRIEGIDAIIGNWTGDHSFMGRSYPKGCVVEAHCVDVYTFAQDGTIKECRVYTKFKEG